MRPLGALLHLPAAALLTATLAACGGGAGDERAEGDAGAGAGGGGGGTPVVLRERLVTATDAGEAPDEVAVPVGDDAALAEFTADLSDGFAGEVAEAAAALEAGGDEELAAQVVAVGCDEPTSVRARRTPEGAVVLEAAQVPSPGRQCFAPMTTVAVVVLEAGALSAG